MSEYTTVAQVGEIPDGQGRTYTVNGRMIAVFHEDGEFKATDDLCPHMGASLAGGYLEKGVVVCPWHAWRFCVDDGAWTDNPELKIDTFDVRLDGDNVQVSVPPREPID